MYGITCKIRVATLLAALLSLFLGVSEAFAWMRFTDEELTMQAPDWCSDADVLALTSSSDYDVNPFSGISGTHCHRIKIFTDKGKEAGSTRIVVPFGSNLTSVSARTIKPDGKTVKVKSDQIFKKTVNIGPDRWRRITVYEIAFPEVVAGSILECQWETFSERLTFVPPHYYDVDGMPTLACDLAFKIPQGVVYNLTNVNIKKFNFQDTTDTGISPLGKMMIYRAHLSKVKTGSDEVFSPGDDFLRPHVYFVFAQYKNAGINVKLVPDWQAAVKRVEEFYAPFREKSRLLPPILSRLSENVEKQALPEVLYRWVTDSIEYVDSRLWTDVSGTVDTKLGARKATGVEKALVLMELFKLAGIPSHLLLMNSANTGPTLTKLPTLSQFETYLIAIVRGGATVFLDPTHEGTPFGAYPWALGRVQGLVVDAEEPSFVLVPEASKNNLIRYDLVCDLDSLGTIKVDGSIVLTNQFDLSYRSTLASLDTNGLKEELTRTFLWDYVPADLSAASFNHNASTDTSCTVNFTLSKSKYAKLMGDEVILTPNCISRIPTDYLPQDDQRLTDIHFSFPSTVVIEARYVLPSGIAAVPELRSNISLSSELRYSATVDTAGYSGGFVYSRRLVREISESKAGAYEELRGFYSAVSERDFAEIVLRRR